MALALALLLAPLAAPARGVAPPPPLPQDLRPAEIAALEEIALLPGQTRLDVLRAAAFPAGLLRLDALARSFTVSEEKLGALVAAYPPEIGEALRALLADAELLERLLGDPKLVVALGAAWRLEPLRTEAALAALGREVERERAEAAARAEAEAREAQRESAARAAEEQAEREARRWSSSRYDPWWYGPGIGWGWGSGWYGGPWYRSWQGSDSWHGKGGGHGHGKGHRHRGGPRPGGGRGPGGGGPPPQGPPPPPAQAPLAAPPAAL